MISVWKTWNEADNLKAMEDKTFQLSEPARRRREEDDRLSVEIDQELEELGREIEEMNQILGLPPMDQMLSDSNKRR